MSTTMRSSMPISTIALPVPLLPAANTEVRAASRKSVSPAVAAFPFSSRLNDFSADAQLPISSHPASSVTVQTSGARSISA